MKKSTTLSAVIFDMDGVMFDTERLARRAWEEAMADWGYVIPEQLYLSVMGKAAPRVKADFQEAFGHDLPIEEITARKQCYLEDALAREGVPVKPGLLELLDHLEQWRIPKAVASSTTREGVLRNLAKAGVGKRFEGVIGGDEVKRSKPEPDLFLAAAGLLGVPAGECMVLEDSEAGIQAAYAAGMVPFMVPDLKPPSEDIRLLVQGIFSSLHEVREYLRLLRNSP